MPLKKDIGEIEQKLSEISKSASEYNENGNQERLIGGEPEDPVLM